MARFYENFHKFDIQEFARENREDGENLRLIKLVAIKYKKGKPTEAISDEVEEDVDTVNEIIKAIETFSPDEIDERAIFEGWKKSKVVV